MNFVCTQGCKINPQQLGKLTALLSKNNNDALRAAGGEQQREGSRHGDASTNRPHQLAILAHAIKLEHGDHLAVNVVAADLRLPRP